ncbi:HlyD family type I secretion periplasmic adaptor subunit [Rhodanobacter sp. AS-Z3]|uniref:HlyD family type I secretion periplasmic adaptor subunit n=1 Tax=Rhodanobacter sp. AS-Z3 TaxID=3031330 RepID=UPI002479685C|nr:HlyD family type I secretion periplasmic adaptor subunit [Rhodanobacter sp. AS-Z3]WEN13776.1 HlyD family type I secretion periplasmic adaptor subunit [Rhodanobacter sp. AS-Z3]
MNRWFEGAASDLWRHYGEVFRAAWAERDAHAPSSREIHEAEFLPAHLELMETPLHPAPRWTIRIIVTLVLLTLLIAMLGKLDIVVVANGELIPDSNVKVVQPAITGVVRAIHVHDGQQVVLGQALVDLDTRQAAADTSTAHDHRVHAALAMARVQALLSAVATDRLPSISRVAEASVLDQQQAADLAAQTWQAYVDKRQGARDELSARQADLASTGQEIAKLEATAPLAEQEADAYRALLAKKDVAQMDYLEREQTAQNQIHELAAQRSHALLLMATIRQQKADLAGVTSGFLRDERLELDKVTQDFTASGNEESKTSTRQALLTLKAPEAGTVQQLAIHTLGGVVTTAQALMEIVPKDTLRVKATIENRDVGFVHKGQTVVVKVAAFPYTHYGYLTGTVVELANDAAKDNKRGSVFVAYVRLSSNHMRIDERWIDLTPGMAVSAEITTGRRRVISYFLGPLLQNAQESLHER